MLEPTSFFAFILAAFVLAITPGPSILYVLARTVAGGKTDGVASTLGTTAGGLVHVAISAIGLAAVLAASAQVFTLLKYIGAAYLIYLGTRTIKNAQRSFDRPILQVAGSRRVFIEGALTEIFNVKTALFFLAFIPQFVNTETASTPQFIMLGLFCVLLNFLADLAVVLSTARLLPILEKGRHGTDFLNKIAGGIMISLGATLAFVQLRR